ncbi:thioredoxin-disulfide reductase [Agrococcus sp. Marseille-Q4369]|uniref:thioredoxin-disulfide reductase n=1 Tax=Agrococcus sp. Marseille-Q4369 TaxID=2810513 RepID=UPI001B8BFF38|nr:thioredoxin-disulfide reductase [Agrococcus sp. Marseille-Q4369]QUW17983.1 thioredoxin-disulfide reductase [Agrococcus sp. Marseille-Q4369]
MHDVIIIGSGPAGFTAAIYAARANLQPIVLASSVELGGDLMTTTEVENFPGFPNGVQGPELMFAMQQQAERFGADVRMQDATELELDGEVKRVHVGDEVLEARTVIYATGSAYRKLGIAGEERLSGHGVSWCATCDGFFFKQKQLIVVGGGDSAMEEATFLTKFADKVTIVHRSETFRASQVMLDRARADEKIEFLTNATIDEITGTESNGTEQVSGVILRDTVSGRTWSMPIDGVFVAIGSDPRTHLVHGKLDLTDEGTIAVEGRSSRTSVPGVFAAGDVTDPTYRQAVTAAASGTVAALDAQHYLAAHAVPAFATSPEEAAL